MEKSLEFIRKNALGLIFLLAFILRWLFARVPFWEVDSTAFLATVRYLLGQDPGFQGIFYWPPLYPVLAALLAGAGLGIPAALSLIPILCGALLVFPLYRLGRFCFGEKGGLYAALLTAVYPQLVYFSGMKRTEGLYLLFFFWGVYHLQKCLFGEKKSPRSALLAGLFIGLAYLSRFEGLSLFLLGVLWLLVSAWRSRREWGNLLRFLLLFGLAVLPYQMFLAGNHSLLLPRSKLLYDTLESNWVSRGGAYPDLIFTFGLPGEKSYGEIKALAQARPQLQSGLNGTAYLRHLPRVAGGMLSVCWPVLLILVLLGWKELRSRRDLLFPLSLGLLVLPVSLGGFWDTNPRYYVFLAPLLILFSLPGLLEFAEKREKPYFMLVLCGLILSLLPGMPDPLYPSWFYYAPWPFAVLLLGLLGVLFLGGQKLNRKQLSTLALAGFILVGAQNLAVFYAGMSRYAQTTDFTAYLAAYSNARSLMGENPWNAYCPGLKWVKIPTDMEFGEFRRYLYGQKPGLILDARYRGRALTYPFYTNHLKQLLRRGEIKRQAAWVRGSGPGRVLVDLYRPSFPPGPLRQVK